MQALVFNFIKKETLAQVFSCEFCEISENTFFTKQLQTAASGSKIFEHLIFSEMYPYLIIIFIFKKGDLFVSILIHKYQHKSTRVNTNQHESDTSQHESTRVNTSPTRVNTSLKRVNTSPTQVNTNQHKSKSVLDGLTWVNTSPTRV